MDCPTIRTLAVGYLQNGFSRPKQRKFEDHVDGCEQCQRWIKSFQTTTKAVSQLLSDPLPESTQKKLLAEFKKWRERHSEYISGGDPEDRRARLLKVLRHPTAEMQQKLDESRKRGRSFRQRPDLVWFLLLKSMATMGSSRGYAGLIQDKKVLGSVSYQALAQLDESNRLGRLSQAMRKAKVRMPDRKAKWLADNFIKIEEMGGVEAVTRRALALRCREEKLAFMKQFRGIGEKYGRNVWMDLYDPEFRSSIAVDERIKKMTTELGYSFKSYGEHEAFYKELAEEAQLEPWALDRLIYNFTDYLLSAVRGEPPANKTPAN